MELPGLVEVLARWLHILSAITLIGAIFFIRGVLVPAGQTALVERLRSGMMLAVAGLLSSGVYNYLRVPQHAPVWHAVFGVKMLLALHVFAISWILVSKPSADARRSRLLTGLTISGMLIVFLSACLRVLSLAQ